MRPNQISVRNLDSGESATLDAPFSCGHLLAEDIDILEHASRQLFKKTTGSSWFSFPRVKVTIAGRVIHNVERKVIRDALKNGGASQVTFDPAVHDCDEQSTAQRTYVEMATRKR